MVIHKRILSVIFIYYIYIAHNSFCYIYNPLRELIVIKKVIKSFIQPAPVVQLKAFTIINLPTQLMQFMYPIYEIEL